MQLVLLEQLAGGQVGEQAAPVGVDVAEEGLFLVLPCLDPVLFV